VTSGDPMSGHSVVCTKCSTPLPPGALNTDDLTVCPACGVSLQAMVFPAFFRTINPGSAGEKVLADTDAGCFYHPQKKAVIPCDNCGRFLCALCDVELDGRHLCPSCLESGEKKGRLKSLEKSNLLMDDIALAVAVLPLLFWPLTLLTAPTSIFLCIRYWRTRLSILPRTRLRFLAAFIFASLQILGWSVALYFLLIKK
jgi:hypothetical protein